MAFKSTSFIKMGIASLVQHPQHDAELLQNSILCPCAASNSFEGHKSSSSRSSTTAWRRESSTRRSLLLRVCVPRQSQFTHQQLLQYAGFLPRVHRMETEAAIRAPGECKLSCVVPLSVCVYYLPLVVCLRKAVELISSEANRKIAHVACEMQYDLIVTSMRSKCTTWKEVFLQSLKVTQRNYGGSSLWILRIGGTTDQRR